MNKYITTLFALCLIPHIAQGMYCPFEQEIKCAKETIEGQLITNKISSQYYLIRIENGLYGEDLANKVRILHDAQDKTNLYNELFYNLDMWKRDQSLQQINGTRAFITYQIRLYRHLN